MTGVARRCRFSIVICTFNRAGPLRDALRTALQQQADGRFDFEVLVVDNNSTDATRATVEEFITAGHRNLRYFFEGRQGKSFALNTALDAVSGSHYVIVDDDFLLPPDWLARIFDGLCRYPDASFVGGKVLPEWSGTPPAWLTQEHWAAVAMADFGPTAFATSEELQVCLLACTFRVDDVRAVGGYDTRLGVRGRRIGGVEDLDLLRRLWKAGRTGVYLPDVAFLHRAEPERLTKRYHRRWHRDHGRSHAIMRNPSTEEVPQLFGVPRHMYWEVLENLTFAVVRTLRGHAGAAFKAETRLWFIFGFVRERWTEGLTRLREPLGRAANRAATP
ncbi:MAG TPA: glycosyltransferase family 2 protein [Gemmatimonadaceae bacterium]|jgi:glycosyltransferase involved in cell wall biosynthesis